MDYISTAWTCQHWLGKYFPPVATSAPVSPHTVAGRGALEAWPLYCPKRPGQIRNMSMIPSRRRLMTLNGGQGFFLGERGAKSVRDVLNW